MILNILVSIVQTVTHPASAWVDDVSHDVEARLDHRSVEGGPLGHGKHCLSYVSDNNLSVSSRGSSDTSTAVGIDGSTTRASVHFHLTLTSGMKSPPVFAASVIEDL